ncbi:MAG: hypothetical protein PHV18_12725 [Lachnospiraceae bacterium]|nr:hypothetical protein [Lachnospiraceae bacterium]
MNRSLKHNYRVSEYEDKVIRNKAKRAKTSVSAFVRKAALQKDIVVIDGLREMLAQLHAIGNNLNQQTVIMRQSGGYAPQVEQMKTSFCDVMNGIKSKLREEDGDGDCQNHQQADR